MNALETRDRTGTGSGPGDRSMQALIASYHQFEGLCAEAMEDNRALGEEIARESAALVQSGLHGRMGAGWAGLGEDGPHRALSPAELAKRSYLARRAIPAALPMRGKAFALRGDQARMTQLEQIENRITMLRFQMKDLEDAIVERHPSTVAEAAAKLRFLVALLLNDDDFDKDYFAYLVDECAQVVAA